MQILLIPLIFFSFTQAEIDEYERQSYEAMKYDQALYTVYEGDLAELEHVFSNFSLALLTAAELRLLRNMIYAQHGYSFNSQDLREWFRKFDWYEPLTTDVDDYMTWVDSMNIARIRKFEFAYKESDKNIVSEDSLIGIWHSSPIVAAGYNDLLYFFSDGTFRCEFNQMDWSKRLLGMSGKWTVEGRRFVLQITHKTILTGGEIVEPSASCGSDFAIENGISLIDEVSPYELMTFPITEIEEFDMDVSDDLKMLKISIGTADFWKLYDDPNTKIY